MTLNLCFHALVWGNVSKFADRRSQLLPSVVENHQRGTDGCPPIGRLPRRPSEQRDRNANECKRGGEGITSVVPGVAFDREAADRVAHGTDVPEKQFLDDEYAREHDQCVRRRCAPRRGYFTNAFVNNSECSGHQCQARQLRRQEVQLFRDHKGGLHPEV